MLTTELFTVIALRGQEVSELLHKPGNVAVSRSPAMSTCLDDPVTDELSFIIDKFSGDMSLLG